MKQLIIAAVALLLMAGCKSADIAQMKSLGSKHRVTLYSGGVAVGKWVSKGNVSNEDKSDGFYFEDDATGKLVEVVGTLVIEQE